ncbi:LuxR C-terminal-related transcriptional regulator [Aliiglaciecola sp. 3_MG-2023]|uniref:response regulator transcription factor n=1 Tax=Aliiglaciecola sp. 3_MG-2023 TaxID=3062644 RepID=UPI0026E1890C|nr:LuxR C-terminal-related transcriptional regulator [Aliiglaciecola sp. 3_MG-2023]MDO6695732.1 LuxR C-terminal-related transcriptional regulator [Aliiglaciecola sp. 3_MG-2023]
MENMLEFYQNKLSKREAQVANKVREGLSNRSIAEQLFISERTVKFHCTNIFRKLAINNRKMLRTLFPNAYETA